MNEFMFNLPKLISLVFHVFMFVVVIYSAMNVFALIRFGRSKAVGFLVFVIYGLMLGSLYLEATVIISRF